MALDFIVFNDPHLADKPPLGRKDGYREEGLAMLRELVELANEHDAWLISTGDLFHIKRPQHVSHALVREIIDILKRLNNSPCMIVPGNHDMGMRGIDSLPRQPLGVVFESGAAAPLIEAHPGFNGWILIGRPYNMERDADPSYYAFTPEATAQTQPNAPICVVAHGSIIPPTQQRPYPTVACTDIDTTGINLLVSGHIHEDLGIYPMQEGPKKPLHIFANLGALGRVSRTEANMTRTIKALGVKLNGQDLTLLELPINSALPASEIFVEHTVSDIDSDAIADVVTQIVKTELGIEGVGFEAALRLLDLSPELMERALKYLENADVER